MSVTIDGSGTITGISAGGLPDGSITNDDLAGSIDDAKLSGTTCKAFVNFDGTGTPAIRAQFNVSSITDNGTGDYTVNFTTAMADTSYVPLITAHVRSNQTAANSPAGLSSIGDSVSPFASLATGSVNIIHRPTSANSDPDMIGVAIFR
jgi:hypothetical protein